MQYRGWLHMCAVLAVLLSVLESSDGRHPGGSEMFRLLTSGYAKRVSVFDRMGRYYGKRSAETRDTFNVRPSVLSTVQEFRDQLSTSSRLLDALLRVYVDKNGDGYIDENEASDLRTLLMNA